MNTKALFCPKVPFLRLFKPFLSNISSFRTALKNGKLYHDTALLNTDLDHNAYFGDTKDEPFFPENNEESVEFFQKRTNLSQSYNSNYENLIHEGHNWDSVIDLKMDVLYRKRTQSLCRGIVSNKYFQNFPSKYS